MNLEFLEKIPTEALKKIREEIGRELKCRRKRESLSKKLVNPRKVDPLIYEGSKQFNKAIQVHNSSGPYALRNLSNSYKSRLRYLPALIDQDWSHIYPRDCETGSFYVYLHLDPGEKVFSVAEEHGGLYPGKPFYVGKGSGDRAHNLKRNQGHGKKIKKLIDEGVSPSDIVYIPFKNLNEQKALELEAKLIYFFGSIYERGNKTGVLYNLDIPKVPDFEGAMEKFSVKEHFKKLQQQREAEVI